MEELNKRINKNLQEKTMEETQIERDIKQISKIKMHLLDELDGLKRFIKDNEYQYKEELAEKKKLRDEIKAIQGELVQLDKEKARAIKQLEIDITKKNREVVAFKDSKKDLIKGLNNQRIKLDKDKAELEQQSDILSTNESRIKQEVDNFNKKIKLTERREKSIEKEEEQIEIR